jgi:hypothetical protein
MRVSWITSKSNMKVPASCTLQNADVTSHISDSNCLNYYLYSLSKSIPLQAWTGPEISRRLRFPSRYNDLLRAGRSRDRFPAGARFSTNVQTGPGAHLAIYTMGTWSFPRVDRPGRSVDHPPPSSVEVKERVELYLSSPLGFRGLF